MTNRPELRVPLAEHLLINACTEVSGPRVLCTSLGRGQCAESIALAHPESQVTCHFVDQYFAEETADFLKSTAPGVKITCSADLPAEEFDAFILPVTRGGEAELNRDWLQTGFDRLKIGGWLYTAVDYSRDKWLYHEVEKLGKGVMRRSKSRGMIYKLQKREPLKRLRDFGCEFAFRDGGNLIKAYSRPGVFSHRQLDLGARALLEGVEVEPADRVLELGCGSGVVSLAAVLRAPGVSVYATDSNARAVACTQRGAELNGLSDRVTVALDADGSTVPTDEFDLVIGNPPYYSQYKIADIFLQTARKALKPNGRLAIVTKRAEWFEGRMHQLFKNRPTVAEHRGYLVVSVRKPG